MKGLLMSLAAGAAMAAAICGCGTDYCWRSGVPAQMRTVAVPTFRNESNVSELGSIATRQLLREFQREGTFRIRSAGDAALEIQGVIKSTQSNVNAYNRRAGLRMASFDFVAKAEISVIDKANRRVLVNNRPYVATTSYTAGQDSTTAMRDASGRLMDELARQVVDDVLKMKWKGENQDERDE